MDNKILSMTIYPPSYFYFDIVNLKNITVDEDEYFTITSDVLSIKHSVSEPEKILYLIKQMPRHGILVTTNMTTQPKNDSLLFFTQKDIDDGLIQYKYKNTDNFHSKNISYLDEIRFDATNGIAIFNDITMFISIISKIITLFTGNITVTEGQSIALIPADFAVLNEYYSNKIEEFIIIEEPKSGAITFTLPDETKSYTKKFTPLHVERGYIAYEHDGSETTSDWLTVVARFINSEKESLPSTIHISIEPVNDETPNVVNNTGLELWEGTNKVITNTHLAAIDDDSVSGNIIYQISTPSNGYITLFNNPQTHIEMFTQQQIDSNQIVYFHSGDLTGGFRFQVTDGVNFDSPHVFTITAKSVTLTMIVNQKLRVFPGVQQSLTRDHLLVTSNDGNENREFLYQVIREPKYGRFLLEKPDGSTKITLSFTQKQIDQNLVLYEQNKPLSTMVVSEEILIDVESKFVQPLKGIKFIIEIAIENFGNDVTKELSKLIQIKPLNVSEGKSVKIDENCINITKLINKWQTKQYKGFLDKIVLKFYNNPSHGIIVFEEKVITESFNTISIEAFSKKSLAYKHDDSNTFNDIVNFGIFLQNGIDILLLNQTLQINIIPGRNLKFLFKIQLFLIQLFLI